MTPINWPEKWETAETEWCRQRCADADLDEVQTNYAMTHPWKWLNEVIQEKIVKAYRER